MRRPTMKDVAQATGVSRGAASFALNDRPGVSEETRRRVKQVAAEMGWTPSPAALALSSRSALAVGLVVTRSSDSFASEGFFLRLIAGIERALQPAGLSLMLQIVPDLETEMDACRRWWAQGRVDGVLLVDPLVDDPRPSLLAELGLPAVSIGGGVPASGLSVLGTDDDGAMGVVMQHLVDQGRRDIAYVAGLMGLQHSRVRAHAAEAEARRHGVSIRIHHTDFSEEAARRHTTDLLARPEQRPTGIIYDNEILAVGGLMAIVAAGLRCPADVAVVSCEDSPLCRAVHPSITSLARDPALLGERSAQMLLELISGAEPTRTVESVPTLAVRQSSLTP